MVNFMRDKNLLISVMIILLVIIVAVTSASVIAVFNVSDSEYDNERDYDYGSSNSKYYNKSDYDSLSSSTNSESLYFSGEYFKVPYGYNYTIWSNHVLFKDRYGYEASLSTVNSTSARYFSQDSSTIELYGSFDEITIGGKDVYKRYLSNPSYLDVDGTQYVFDLYGDPFSIIIDNRISNHEELIKEILDW
jgi:hypothetical protein